MSNKLQSFADLGALDKALSEIIIGSLQSDIELTGRASLALSGGRTPKSLFQLLSIASIDWEKVVVTLVDERWVDENHPDSNEKLVRDYLLQNKAKNAKFISLKTQHSNPKDACETLEVALKTLSDPFSSVVLGMGPDGHTASFFPASSTLTSCLDINNPSACSHAEPSTELEELKKMHPRMTLTLSRLLNSRNICLQITGNEKKAVFEAAINAQNDSNYPIATVLRASNEVQAFWTP